MNSPPIVTCVVPSYNHELWVQDALFSLVNQNYPNLRIICIDDGSTDNTWAKIKEICEPLKPYPTQENSEPVELFGGLIKNIPIIIAKFSKNYGPSQARNYGIKTAWNDTDLYAFLDSDDEYLPGKIEKSVQPFIRYGDNLIGVVFSDYITENVQTGLQCREFKAAYSREFLLKECNINCDSLVSKAILAKVGLFEEDLRTCEDYSQWIRLTEKSIAIHLPEKLLKIRVGKHSSTDNVSKDNWEKNYSTVIRRLKERHEI